MYSSIISFTIRDKKMKTSIVWTSINDEDFIALVKKSKTYGDIFEFFGFRRHSNNYVTVKKRIKALKIDTSHFQSSYSYIALYSQQKKKTLKEILIKNSTYNRYHLKIRLLEEGLLEHRCYICGLAKQWNNKPINMVIDHINGIPNDHRLENLRMVCPNCNSQLETHCGKNNKRNKKTYHCACGAIVGKKSKRCIKCNNKNKRIVDRPTKEQLKEDVKELGYRGTGKKYGVSDKSIKKWLI